MHEVKDLVVSSVQGSESFWSRATRLNMKLPSISVSSEINFDCVLPAPFQYHLFKYYLFQYHLFKAATFPVLSFRVLFFQYHLFKAAIFPVLSFQGGTFSSIIFSRQHLFQYYLFKAAPFPVLSFHSDPKLPYLSGARIVPGFLTNDFGSVFSVHLLM